VPDLSGHNRVSLNGQPESALFRGLSLSLFGSASRIEDQLYLPTAGLTDEEIWVNRLSNVRIVDYRTLLKTGSTVSTARGRTPDQFR
jgi:hypothetical protein